MSGWYSDLTPEELTGKHVRVRFDNGTVIEGPLVYDELDDFMQVGPIRIITCAGGRSVKETGTTPVLTRDSDLPWYRVSDVKSIALVWDERDWEPVELHDAVEGDMLVVNGELYPIRKVVPVEKRDGVAWIVGSPAYFVAPFMVSCALRRKEVSDGV